MAVREFDFWKGETLLIDKPLYWTSFDCVNKIRTLLKPFTHGKRLKIGHAGTLDPLATGLLIICTGKMTRSITTYQDLDKVYEGTLVLGATTPSHDLETEVKKQGGTEDLNETLIREAALKLTGTYQQVPPEYSAVSVGGRRAYHFARSNRKVTLSPKIITVSEFTIHRMTLPEVYFSVTCSKGTYIRALARDLGHILGCGAYLKFLRRTRIGNFSVEDAVSLDEFSFLVGEIKKDRKMLDK
jgi:tRNA pseudouridine55 synthase